MSSMEDMWAKYAKEREKNLAEEEPHHGKRDDQKMKPYLVLQFLLKNSDQDNPKTAKQIIAFLKEGGLTAERRYIYKDIQDINLVEIIKREECTVQDAKRFIQCLLCQVIEAHAHVKMMPQTVEMAVVCLHRFVGHSLRHLRGNKAWKDFLNFPTFAHHFNLLFCHKSDPLPSRPPGHIRRDLSPGR